MDNIMLYFLYATENPKLPSYDSLFPPPSYDSLFSGEISNTKSLSSDDSPMDNSVSAEHPSSYIPDDLSKGSSLLPGDPPSDDALLPDGPWDESPLKVHDDFWTAPVKTGSSHLDRLMQDDTVHNADEQSEQDKEEAKKQETPKKVAMKESERDHQRDDAKKRQKEERKKQQAEEKAWQEAMKVAEREKRRERKRAETEERKKEREREAERKRAELEKEENRKEQERIRKAAQRRKQKAKKNRGKEKKDIQADPSDYDDLLSQLSSPQPHPAAAVVAMEQDAQKVIQRIELCCLRIRESKLKYREVYENGENSQFKDFKDIDDLLNALNIGRVTELLQLITPKDIKKIKEKNDVYLDLLERFKGLLPQEIAPIPLTVYSKERSEELLPYEFLMHTPTGFDFVVGYDGIEIFKIYGVHRFITNIGPEDLWHIFHHCHDHSNSDNDLFYKMACETSKLKSLKKRLEICRAVIEAVPIDLRCIRKGCSYTPDDFLKGVLGDLEKGIDEDNYPILQDIREIIVRKISEYDRPLPKNLEELYRNILGEKDQPKLTDGGDPDGEG